MADDSFFAAAEAVHAGTITINEFAARAAPRWRRWAAVFERRYKLPPWFAREDVEQELALAAWQHLGLFDAARGVKAGRFVEWNAVKRATKSVARARGVNQHTRRGPARPEVPASHVPEEVMAAAEPSAPAEQDDLLDALAVYSSLRERAGQRAPVVDALARERGEVDAAGLALYADPRARLRFRLSNAGEAATLVRETIRTLAEEVTT